MQAYICKHTYEDTINLIFTWKEVTCWNMHVGILAVVPILVQWLLASYTQTYSTRKGRGGYEDTYSSNHIPPKSHWTLLAG